MNFAVLNRRIDPTQPLSDAASILMNVRAIAAAGVPTVSKSVSRHARRFKRSVEGHVQGATSFFRRNAVAAFSLAKAPTMTRTNMASSLLMAQPRTASARPATPQVSVLNMSQMRARANLVRTAASLQKKAVALMGTLSARFAANANDWTSDHHRDTSRMVWAQARFATSRGPTPNYII